MEKQDLSPPFEVVALDHIVVRTRQLEAVLLFYRDRLGLAVERVVEEFGLYQLRAGFSLIDILDENIAATPLDGGEAAAAGADPRYDHFCLALAGVAQEELGAYLEAIGIPPVEVGRRYGATGYGSSFYVRDPDGRTVELKVVDGEDD